jgi:hypothetical protein
LNNLSLQPVMTRLTFTRYVTITWKARAMSWGINEKKFGEVGAFTVSEPEESSVPNKERNKYMLTYNLSLFASKS